MGQIHGPSLGSPAAIVTSQGELLVTGSVINTPTAASDIGPQTFEDTSFVVGDSPATLDVNAALGRNATQFTLINDGAGDFTVAISNSGANFGDDHTMKNGEIYSLDRLSIDSIRITHVADSAFRVVVI